MEVKKEEVITVVLTEHDVKEAIMNYVRYRDSIKGTGTISFDCSENTIYDATVVIKSIISESKD